MVYSFVLPIFLSLMSPMVVRSFIWRLTSEVDDPAFFARLLSIISSFGDWIRVASMFTFVLLPSMVSRYM